jgi:hypothetical protein
MIAYCGLQCDSCPIYFATMEQDQSQQQAMRVLIAEQCSNYYRKIIQPEEVTDCEGCIVNTGGGKGI